ncbi:MAG: hypothetical protein QXS05_06320 [Candidatus Bathyarchaeia archaeon]
MPYTSIGEVKALAKLSPSDLGLQSESEFDGFISKLILYAQSLIDSFCNLPEGFFEPGGIKVIDEEHDYNQPIRLNLRPIISIQTVEVYRGGAWQTLSPEDYTVDYKAGLIMIIGKAPALTGRSVRISYTAGYIETPEAIKYAAAQICVNMLHMTLQRRITPTIRLDDWAIRMVMPEALTQELQGILKPFMRRNVEVG